jgi:hypothetical protein
MRKIKKFDVARTRRMAALSKRTEEQLLAGIAADPDAYLATAEDFENAVLVLPDRKRKRRRA